MLYVYTYINSIVLCLGPLIFNTYLSLRDKVTYQHLYVAQKKGIFDHFFIILTLLKLLKFLINLKHQRRIIFLVPFFPINVTFVNKANITFYNMSAKQTKSFFFVSNREKTLDCNIMVLILQKQNR